MLGAARNEERGVAEYARHDGADGAADMPLLVDVAVVEHRVRPVPDKAIPRRLALDETSLDPPALAHVQLIAVRKSKRPEHGMDGGKSSASAIGAWPIVRSPPQSLLRPMTTISLQRTSTPAETLATLE